MLYWQLTGLGVACAVIAPTLIPVKAGDHRRDAMKLARHFRSGELTRIPRTRRSATQCARGWQPSRISCGIGIGWGGFSSATGAGPRRA